MKKKKKKLKPQRPDVNAAAEDAAVTEIVPGTDAAESVDMTPAEETAPVPAQEANAEPAQAEETEPAPEEDSVSDALVEEAAPAAEETADAKPTAPAPEGVADEDGAEDDDDAEEDPEFRGILEALIFASDEPLTFKQIKELLAPNETGDEETVEEETAPTRGRRRKTPRLTITRVKRAIDWLNDAYSDSGRSFRIIEVSGGFAFQTTGEYGAWVGRLFAERSRRRLTQSALETLSIIAFRQPISKPAVEGIRGVNADHVVKSLLERNLISIVGREDSPGRPLLYGTTKTFLKHFGLSSINDLPKPREIKDLLSSEEELSVNPIDEMDPDKAAALTRVSSQELERLFDNARLREQDRSGDPEDAVADDAVADDAVADDAVADDAVADDAETDEDPAIDSGAQEDDAPISAPVLHVQFDDLPDENGADGDSETVGEDEASGMNNPPDESETDDEIETMIDDDISGDDDFSAEHTPFDDESPDEQEMI